MSKSVFISHAAKDKKLVAAIVDLLESGIGVPEKEIFCSSLTGYGIPTGENFVTYIKNQIQKPKCVILLITPSYFGSNFCLAELGAAWAMSHKTFPILVEPIGYSDVKDVLLGTQVAKIDDDIKYNELRDYLLDAIACEKKSNTKWDTTRKVFLEKIPKLIADMSPLEMVSTEEHEALKERLEEQIAELTNYQREIDKKNDYITKLKAAKDKEEVQNLEASVELVDDFDALDKITENISNYKSYLSPAVLKFILCEHYNQPYEIDWYNDKQEFSDAARSNFIDLEDGESVNWDNHRMKKLAKLLKKIDHFEDNKDDGFAQAHFDKYDVPFEPSNQEFWSFHY